MKKLRPIVARQKHEKAIADKIDRFMLEQVYKPLFDILKGLPKAALKQNSGPGDALKKAIHDGQVLYEQDHFIGTFSAKTSKDLKQLGAKWSTSRKSYQLSPDKVPADIKGEISKSRAKAIETSETITEALAKAQEKPVEVDISQEVSATMDDLACQMEKTVTPHLEVPMAMEGFIQDRIEKEYTNNLELDIKNWRDEAIVRLRKQVQSNAVKGFRASALVEAIQAEYGVSRNKAKFLARQETTLLTSQYRKDSYIEIGLEEYQWSTSQDRRVRDEHRVMNGRRCRWDNQNVYWDGKKWADRGNIGGVKLHPGEDWQCRCIAIPLLNEQEK